MTETESQVIIELLSTGIVSALGYLSEAQVFSKNKTFGKTPNDIFALVDCINSAVEDLEYCENKVSNYKRTNKLL